MSTVEAEDLWKQLSLEVIVTVAENGNEHCAIFGGGGGGGGAVRLERTDHVLSSRVDFLSTDVTC